MRTVYERTISQATKQEENDEKNLVERKLVLLYNGKRRERKLQIKCVCWYVYVYKPVSHIVESV